MVDSVVTWAREYKVDGFRFDLMGHHPKAQHARRAAGAATTARAATSTSTARAGTSARSPTTRASSQATQLNMAGTGIGTFNDRLRDAVRGGGPFDADPRIQGFATGLFTDPNGAAVTARPSEQRARLLLYQDQIKVGLAGNLRDYRFVDRNGQTVTGSQVDYNGQPAGYAAEPDETITYVDAHDNETLFDVLQYKLPQDDLDGRPRADEHRRAATTALAPGPVVLARRDRPAALQVARPQQLQLGRLVQPDRLVLRGLDVGLRAAAARRQRVQVGLHAAAARGPGARAEPGRHPRRPRPRRRAAAHPLLVAAVPARQRARDPAARALPRQAGQRRA